MRTTPKRIVLATGNAGKVRELSAMLAAHAIEILPQNSLGVHEISETGLTFVENALLKARHAAEVTGLPAVADDSGLEVDALKGAPGIYSARYAGDAADDASNNAKLLAALHGKPEADRGARFVSVIVYLEHADDPTPLIAQGFWEGRILEHARGSGGFGYDPLFWVPSQQCASAELPPEEKNRLSHRGMALRDLTAQMAVRYQW